MKVVTERLNFLDPELKSAANHRAVLETLCQGNYTKFTELKERLEAVEVQCSTTQSSITVELKKLAELSSSSSSFSQEVIDQVVRETHMRINCIANNPEEEISERLHRASPEDSTLLLPTESLEKGDRQGSEESRQESLKTLFDQLKALESRLRDLIEPELNDVSDRVDTVENSTRDNLKKIQICLTELERMQSTKRQHRGQHDDDDDDTHENEEDNQYYRIYFGGEEDRRREGGEGRALQTLRESE